MPEFQTVRGMRDILPNESQMLVSLMDRARKLAKLYGYDEVILPTIESYELFAAKSGGEIKERMYVFNDLSGRKVVLRPEATASIARIVATKLSSEPKPLRLFYIINAFRYDEPQKGRYREFWQAGYELIGTNSPLADAELISMLVNFIVKSGFKNYNLKIGHMGILRGVLSNIDESLQDEVAGLIDRNKSNEAYNLLKENKIDEIKINTLKQLSEIRSTPKKDIFKKAHEILKDFEQAKNGLKNLEEIINHIIYFGVNKRNILIDLGFARGLAYYTGVIFEIYAPGLDIALGGGGRYDNLIQLFGGNPTPASGFAIGLDRVELACKEILKTDIKKNAKKIMVTSLVISPETLKMMNKLSLKLRGFGIPVTIDVSGKGLKRTLSYASSQNFTHIIIIGEKELSQNAITVKNLLTGKQVMIPITQLKPSAL
ncbi:MAG: histidine--tRNA ligase [Thermoprotei archaeon]